MLEGKLDAPVIKSGNASLMPCIGFPNASPMFPGISVIASGNTSPNAPAAELKPPDVVAAVNPVNAGSKSVRKPVANVFPAVSAVNFAICPGLKLAKPPAPLTIPAPAPAAPACAASNAISPIGFPCMPPIVAAVAAPK